MKILGFKFAEYWHIEVVLLIPFCIWFIWRVETIVGLLRQCIL